MGFDYAEFIRKVTRWCFAEKSKFRYVGKRWLTERTGALLARIASDSYDSPLRWASAQLRDVAKVVRRMEMHPDPIWSPSCNFIARWKTEFAFSGFQNLFAFRHISGMGAKLFELVFEQFRTQGFILVLEIVPVCFTHVFAYRNSQGYMFYYCFCIFQSQGLDVLHVF